jgi:hypothetical protein
MTRWIRFLFAIMIGVGLGLAYGWFARPAHSVDTSPDTLRIDYKTDFVLMVAEAYQYEQDSELALRRLAVLGDTPPLEMIGQSIQFAQKAGYTEPDIARMRALLSALQTQVPSQGSGVP